MKKVGTLILILACSFMLNAQITISSEEKSSDRFAFSTGLTFSSNYFDKDPSSRAIRGLFTQFTWHPTTTLRVSAEYNRHFNHNIGITWSKVKSHDMDMNVHLIAFLPDGESYFYPLVGINYNIWAATYTGLFKPLDGNPPAMKGERVFTNALRANLGCGMEFKLNDYIALMGEFRFRLIKGEQKNTIEISDAMYRAGVAFHLSTIKIKRNPEEKLKTKGKKYRWF